MGEGWLRADRQIERTKVGESERRRETKKSGGVHKQGWGVTERERERRGLRERREIGIYEIMATKVTRRRPE